MKRRIFIAVVILSGLVLAGCSGSKGGQRVNLIFETDMGNDVDDVLALDLIHKYQNDGRVNLLMVGINKSGLSSAEFIDIMDTWYGYPDVPIGFGFNGVETNPGRNFNDTICALKGPDGKPAFRRSMKGYSSLPSAQDLYRKILASQKDCSVTIASVGFSTNLARLMESGPDEYSPLTGIELIRKKVKLLSVMAGDFKNTSHREYNVMMDVAAAKKVLEHWPTPVVASPWDVGDAVKYPAESIENDFLWSEGPHPLIEAYKAYLPMPYDRQTWDPTAVLFAVEGDSWFTMSSPGRITVDSMGRTTFSTEAKGDRQYLSVTDDQAVAIRKHFIDLITRKPASQAKL